MSIGSKSSRTQIVIVVTMAALALLSITLTALVVDLSPSSGSGSGEYRNVTMTDAYLKCVDRVNGEYGEDLYSYAMDDLSTRFDQRKKQFLVFMNVEIISGPNRAAELSFVSCEVSVAGAISNFDISIESGADGGTVRRTKGNPFGFEF